MKNVKIVRTVISVLALCFLAASPVVGSPAIEADPPDRIKVFLDCRDCDFSYLRRKLTLVDHVRDPHLADVHILVTRQSTASRGRLYKFNFIGQHHFESLTFQLEFESPQSDTDVLRRQGMLRQLNMGLVPYVAQTGVKQQISVKFDDGEIQTVPKEHDPWNYWVYRLSLSGSGYVQETQNNFSYSGSVRADRITDEWKFRSSAYFRNNQKNFKDGEETIHSVRRNSGAHSQLIYALNERWSVGGFASASSSTFQNIEWALSFSPAIEFNFFPWDESDRRIFSLGYFTGVRHNDYNETTIFDQDEETRFYESLRLELILRESWGEVEARLEGSHYFHDFSKNNLKFEVDVSVRVTTGLSCFFDGRIRSIHDQLYLPKGEATLEEILLRQIDLATTYDLSYGAGFRFTFGSIYNNVVNPRL